jgi:hypothetical protein
MYICLLCFIRQADRFLPLKMKTIPVQIPQSLQSYLDLYEEQPEEAIFRLQKQIKRRGNDAVGYYLLAWLYHGRNMRKEAVQAAWKAKVFAPGSPVMEQLHYFMAHPENFRAWKPVKPVIRRKSTNRNRTTNLPIQDLDSLIEKLSASESKRIVLDPEREEGPDLSKGSSDTDDIVTETLAGIHVKQGNRAAAIQAYQKLSELHPEKKDEYEEKVRQLEQEESGRSE